MNLKILLSLVFALFIMDIAIAESKYIRISADVENNFQGKNLKSSTLKQKCLNGEWDFYPVYEYSNKEFLHSLEFFEKIRNECPNVPKKVKWEKILVPSMWAYYWGMAFLDDEGKTYAKKWGAKVNRAWYRCYFNVPDNWSKEKRIILRFDGAAGISRIFLNGQEVGSHFGSLFPFEFDITNSVCHDAPNELHVFSVERFNVGRGGHALEIPTGRQNQFGIYRNVWLMSSSKLIPENVQIITSVRKKKIDINLEIKNLDTEKQDVDLELDIMAQDGAPIMNLGKRHLKVSSQGKVRIGFSKPWGSPKLWDVGKPNLYFARIRIKKGEKLLCERFERFGFREFWIDGPFFYLNGKKFTFRGDWIHTFWGGCPGEMHPGYMKLIIEQMKSLNFQGPRFTTAASPEWLLDLLDESGFPIIATGITPNYYGDPHPECLEKTLEQVKTWIRRDRNHPSILLWSTMNEASAPSKFHPRYKWQKQVVDIIEKEDPTRPQYNDGHCNFSNPKVDAFFTTGNLAGDLKISCAHYGILYSKGVNDFFGFLNFPKYWPKKRPFIDGEEGVFGILSSFYTSLALRSDGIKGLFYDVEKRRTLSGKWLKRISHAWRAWEIPGFIGYSSFRSSWGNPFPVIKKDCNRQYHKVAYLEYKILNTPGPKGQLVIGHNRDDQPRANPWTNKFPRIKQTSYAKWVADAYSPIFATITRNWDSNYFAGETVNKKIDLVNDLREDAKGMELSWGFFDGDKKLAGKQTIVNLYQGTVERRKLSFKIPEVKKHKEFQLRITLKDSRKKQMSSEILIIHAYPKPAFVFLKKRKVMIYDFKGGTKNALAQLGICLKKFDIKSLSRKNVDLLLLGRDSFKSLSKLQMSQISNYVSAGGNVFIFRQPGKRKVSACLANITAPKHPVFDGLKPELISNWRLKPDNEIVKQVLEWPESGRFRVLVQLGAELAGRHEAVLTEYFKGKGRLVMCKLELTDALKEEPEAQILLRNILKHYSTPGSTEFNKTIYISAPGNDDILKWPFSIDANWHSAEFSKINLEGVKTLILGSMGDLNDSDLQIIKAKIKNFTGSVLVLPQKNYDFINSLLGNKNTVKTKILKGGMGGVANARELIGFYNEGASWLSQGMESVFQPCRVSNVGLPLKILSRLFVDVKGWQPLLTAYQRYPGKSRGEFGTFPITDQFLIEKEVDGKKYILSLLPLPCKNAAVNRIYLTLFSNLGVKAKEEKSSFIFDIQKKEGEDWVVQANGLQFNLKGASEIRPINLDLGKSLCVEKFKSAGIALVRSGVRATNAPFWRFLPGIAKHPGDVNKPIIKTLKTQNDITVERQGLLRDPKNLVKLKYDTNMCFLKNGKFSFDSKFNIIAGENKFHRVFSMVGLNPTNWWCGKNIEIQTEAGKIIKFYWPENKIVRKRIKNPQQVKFTSHSGVKWKINTNCLFDYLELYSNGKNIFQLIFEPKNVKCKRFSAKNANGRWSLPRELVQLQKGDVFKMKLNFDPQMPKKKKDNLFSSLQKKSILPIAKYNNDSKETKRFFFINIVKKCNAPFGGGKWTEKLSSVFHLRKLHGGDYWLNGIPFHLIDADNDELEGGDAGRAMSMIIMRGEYRPDFPDKISGILVGHMARKLFFLQSGVYMSSPSGSWDKNKELKMWKYRVNYADDSFVDIPVVLHQNVKDWYRSPSTNLPGAKVVYMEEINAVKFGVWAQEWENPFPQKVISTIDIKSFGKGIPIILGITGEK